MVRFQGLIHGLFDFQQESCSFEIYLNSFDLCFVQ